MSEVIKNADGGDRWKVDGSNVIRHLGMQLAQEDVVKRMNELEQIALDLVFCGEWTDEHKQARKKFHELFAT